MIFIVKVADSMALFAERVFKESKREGAEHMISNQILQNTIDGLKGITRIDLCIIDVEGKVLAATFPDAEKYVEVSCQESP